ncbi:MAG: porin family protein [Gemmatimonadetes bacterium]|nr:porin family protein [Gemmatimonadota bacterium]
MRWTYAVALAALALPAAASAQHDRTHASLMAGITEFDLSGVGTTGIYALRAAMPWHENLLVEGSLSYARTGQQFGSTDLFLPEIQAQLQGTWRRLSPYLGLGAGVAIDRPSGPTDGPTDVDFAPAFSVGVRVGVARGVGVRIDGRLHGIEADFTGTVSELTGGLMFTW